MSPTMITTPRPVSTRVHRPHRDGWPDASRWSRDGLEGALGEHEYGAMCAAFRATGGAVCADDVAARMRQHERGDYVALARLIVSGAVFGFDWRHTFWIPMFQFDLQDLSVRPGPQHVVRELATEFDGWTLALWFAQPNGRLDDFRPVDLLSSRLPSVIDAARADRLIATR